MCAPNFRAFDAAAGDRVARFFDADYVDYNEDIPVLQAYAKRTGGPLLELGCGTGRVAIPLARAGYQVTGVELSTGMLAIARRRAAEAGVAGRLTLLEGDYTSAALGGPYRFAYCVMNTFLHLPTLAAQLATLRHWRAHLAPGGLLLVDVLFPDVDQLANANGQVEYDKSWVEPGSEATVMKQVIRSADPAEQILHVTFLYDATWPDGRLERTVVPFDLRYLWRFEAQLLFERAGFALEGVYGDWDLNPLDSGMERMILVGRSERVPDDVQRDIDCARLLDH